MQKNLKQLINEKPQKLYPLKAIALIFLFISITAPKTTNAQAPMETIPHPVHGFHDLHTNITPLGLIWDVPFSNSRNVLNSEIEVSKMRQRRDYTEESWRLFELSLQNAILVLNSIYSVEPEMWSTADGVRLNRSRLVRAENTEHEELTQLLKENAEGYMTSLLWLVALSSFSLGITIIKIFAILWGGRK